MPRPRTHDLADLLDHARRLWVRDGMHGVTVRTLALESGVPNGSIYHAFGSRATLLAQVWIREADAFLVFQREIAQRALADYPPPEAVVRVAVAPTLYALANTKGAEGAQLLLSARADDLGGDHVADEQRRDLIRLRRELTTLLVSLATSVWGRTDATAVTLIRLCVVDLPGQLLLSHKRPTDAIARHALEAAVRGIATTNPPPPARGTPPGGDRSLTVVSGP